MNCRQVSELLPLYADGEIEERLRARIAGHVEACPACRRRLEADRALAQALPALPAPGDAAAMSGRLRGRLMEDIARNKRRRSFWRRAAWAGNAAAWAAVAAIAILLVIGLGLSGRSLLARRAQPPAAATAPAGARWGIVADTTIARPYYWPGDGERVDRTPQFSPDGARVAYLPALDSGASDLDRLLVRDLTTGKERDLTPEEGYSYTSVRWSPDGRSLAFVKYRRQAGETSPTEVWRMDADGRNLQLLYRSQGTAPDMRGPALAVVRWSADGKTIELSPTIWANGPLTRRVRADGGGEAAQLPPPQFGVPEQFLVGQAVLSPTDDYALAVAQTDALAGKRGDAPAGGTSLVLYEFAGQQTQVLASVAGQIVLGADSISPAGDWILFQVRPDADSRQGSEYWAVRRDGSGLRQMSVSPVLPGPVWAGDGIAYFNQPREVSAIWICRADAKTGQAQLITNRWPAWELVSASRDGLKLLAIKGVDDEAELHLLELAPVAVEATPATVTFYHQGQADVLPPDLGVYEPLTQAAGQVLSGVRPGIVAAVAEPWQEAERIKREGIALELTYPEPGVTVSDHGAYTTILIPLSEPEPAREASLFLGSGDALRVVSADADEALATLRLMLGVTAGPTRAAPAPPTVAPAFGPPQDLFALPASARDFFLSPDGQWVLCSAAEGAGLLLYSTVSGQVSAVVDGAAGAGLAASQCAWFPDGRLLITTNGGQGLLLLGAPGQWSGQTLAQAPQGSQGYGEVAISPDGRRIACTVYYDASPAPVPRVGVEVMNADGSDRRQIVEPDFFISQLAWTPDGEQVIYFRGMGGTPPEDGDAYVVNAAGGAAPRLLFPRLRPAAFSPDGARVLWLGWPASEQGRADLYLTGWPETGEPKRLAEAVSATTVAWAGDSGGFIYGQGDNLYLAGAQQGSPVKLLSQAETAADPLLWVAGQGLIYRAAVEGRAVLRLLPLLGKPPATAEPLATVSWTAGPTVTLTAVHMLDADTGWATAGPARVLRTADGGRTWQEVTPFEVNVSSRLLTIAGSHFLDARTAWLAVPRGDSRRLRLYRTSDGGQSWQHADIEPEGQGAQFSFLDAQRGWLLLHQGVAAGSEAVTVLRTTDGGATWQALGTSSPQNALAGALPFGGLKTAIAFHDENTGWVTGNAPVDGLVWLYVTHDGGLTWQQQELALPRGLEKAQSEAQPPVFSSPQEGLLPVTLFTGKESSVVIYRTQDGGATWTPGEPLSAPEAGPVACARRAEGAAWVLYRDGQLAVTSDGGRTWQQVTPQPPLRGVFQQLDALDGHSAWIVGQDALLRTQDGGRTWERLEPRYTR